MKVLISAYACEPATGSEPGAGWNWATAAARAHDVWVITRSNNRASIEAAPDIRCDVTFVYVDLPRWARFWKRGQRGIRVYYLLWQVLAARRAVQLHRRHGFDVVHHLTLANVWLPALACVVRAPFVLGPVGGGVAVPIAFYPSLGVRGIAGELLLRVARATSRLNPLTRLSWRRASVIVAQNDETALALRPSLREKTIVRPNASVGSDGRRVQPARAGKVAVYAGRIVPWKGVRLAVEALAVADEWRLVVIGRGPDLPRVRRAAERLGVQDRIEFRPWLTQHQMWNELGAASAVILPSLREDASFVAVEAQAAGVPVVAFDRGGPRVFARSPGTRFELVPLTTPKASAQALARALERLAARPDHATDGRAFDLDAVAADVDRIYSAALSQARDAVAAVHGVRA